MRLRIAWGDGCGLPDCASTLQGKSPRGPGSGKPLRREDCNFDLGSKLIYTFVHVKQLKLMKNDRSEYGGDLLKTRKGRSRPRPLDIKNTMHLVLRSSKAIGNWSFTKKINKLKVEKIIERFASKYAVRIYSIAIVGNHIHLHIKLANRSLYKPFIRGLTAAIAMAVTGASRWNPLKMKFWDCRPYTRIVIGFTAFRALKNYIEINQLEGFGYTRDQAKFRMHEWNAARR